MASTNKTTLGLNQWEGTDKPERVDFNSDNHIIDTQLANSSIYLLTSGTSSGLVVSYPANAQFGEGSVLRIKLHTAIAANATMTVGSITSRILDSKGNGNKIGAIDGSVLTLVYNGSNFILQGEGGGSENITGIAADLLVGKTMNDADGKNISGAMQNNGAISSTITAQNGTYSVPAGYHNGSGAVKATLPDLGAANGTITTPGGSISIPAGYRGTAGTVTATIASPATGLSGYIEATNISSWDGALHLMPPAGCYNGSQWLLRNDANFVASNIRAGVSLLGITGTMQENRYATGTVLAKTDKLGPYNAYRTIGFEEVNIGFRPKSVFLSFCENSDWAAVVLLDIPLAFGKYSPGTGGFYVGDGYTAGALKAKLIPMDTIPFAEIGLTATTTVLFDFRGYTYSFIYHAFG